MNAILSRRRPAVLIGLLLFLASHLAAEQWYQQETEHFTIIYTERDEATAYELIGMAEEIYDSLAQYLMASPDRRIPVVLRGETADANGYFTYLPTRIVLFTATPSTPIIQPNLDQWLRIVFTHELTHYLHISQRVGIGSLASIFGRSFEIVNLVLTPRWMAEGLSVVAETKLSDGGRGRSPVFEMQYVSALLADDFWSLEKNYYGSDFAPRSRVYVGGYVIAEYLIRTYGIDRFMVLTRQMLRRPVLGIRPAMRRVYGVPARDIYDAIVRDLEATYGDRDQIAGGRRVSPDDGGYWFLIRGSTDIFGASPTGYTRVYERGLWADGVQRDDAHVASRVSGDAFSMATSDEVILATIGFAEEYAPEPSVGFTDLVLIDRTSGAMTRVTRGRRLYHPVLAPVSSGEYAYAIERIGGYSRLVRVSLDSAGAGDAESAGKVEPVWEPPQTHMSGPAVSPDGRFVAVAASMEGQQDIYIVDLLAGGARNVTRSHDVPEYFPAFISDRRLWFTANPNGPLQLFELDLPSGDVSLRLSDPDGIFHATPMDDGAVYQSYSVTGPTVRITDRLVNEAVSWPPRPQEAMRGGADQYAQTTVAPDAPDASPRRYTDWPIPELWLPLVVPSRGVSGRGLEYEGIAVEIGGLLAAASPLEQHLILLSGGVNSSTGVPSLALQAVETLGPWQAGFDVTAGPSYVSDSGAEAYYDMTFSASVSRPIRSWRSFASGLAGLRNVLSAGASTAYTVLSGPGIGVSDFLSSVAAQTLVATTGLSYSGARQQRTADLKGPAGPAASISGAMGVPFGSTPQFAALARVGSRLPIGAMMLDTRFGIATADPALQLRVRLDSPAWLLDIALGRLNLTRLGLTLGVRQDVDYSDGSLSAGLASGDLAMELDPRTVVSLELVSRLGFMATSIMPAVGVAVTIPHALPLQPTFALTFRSDSSDPGIVIGHVDPGGLFDAASRLPGPGR